jgi:hypothetical protein
MVSEVLVNFLDDIFRNILDYDTLVDPLEPI